MENTMNRYLATVIAALCAAAGSAFADDITIEPHKFVSTLSRAQVVDELHQFRRSGINPWAQDYNHLAQMKSSITRAEAQAGFLAERSSVAAFSAEDSGSSFMTRMASGMSRKPATELARVE
jgi:hypothetical protein